MTALPTPRSRARSTAVDRSPGRMGGSTTPKRLSCSSRRPAVADSDNTTKFSVWLATTMSLRATSSTARYQPPSIRPRSMLQRLVPAGSVKVSSCTAAASRSYTRSCAVNRSVVRSRTMTLRVGFSPGATTLPVESVDSSIRGRCQTATSSNHARPETSCRRSGSSGSWLVQVNCWGCRSCNSTTRSAACTSSPRTSTDTRCHRPWVCTSGLCARLSDMGLPCVSCSQAASRARAWVSPSVRIQAETTQSPPGKTGITAVGTLADSDPPSSLNPKDQLPWWAAPLVNCIRPNGGKPWSAAM